MNATDKAVFCRSCGDRIGEAIQADSKQVAKQMKTHCRGCSREIVGERLPEVGTTMNGTGGGSRVIKSTRGLS